MSVEITVVKETVEILQDSTVTVVETHQTETVEIGILGPQGPAGPQGPVGPGSTSGLVKVETPIGNIDGVNATFYTSVPFLLGSTVLYLNGLAQSEPQDYNEMSNQSVMLDVAPEPEDRLRISYMEA
jgi:hypothetical protein